MNRRKCVLSRVIQNSMSIKKEKLCVFGKMRKGRNENFYLNQEYFPLVFIGFCGRRLGMYLVINNFSASKAWRKLLSLPLCFCKRIFSIPEQYFYRSYKYKYLNSRVVFSTTNIVFIRHQSLIRGIIFIIICYHRNRVNQYVWRYGV